MTDGLAVLQNQIQLQLILLQTYIALLHCSIDRGIEYCCWYTDNTVNILVVSALSIGSSLVAAVLLGVETGTIFI